MTQDLLERIEGFLTRNELYRGTPATEAQLHRAAEQLGVRFDDDYREFIRLFGGSYVGVPVYGFASIPDEDVVALTLDFRRSYAAADRWPIIQRSYVVAMTGSGDPVILDPAGKVRVYYHDNGSEEVIAASFAELLAQNLPED